MGRAPCCDKANVNRGPWSLEEDATLRSYLERHGTGGNWIALPKKAGLRRCGKSCRLRWLNYLRPDIKHGCFTEEEDEIICSLYNTLGSRWSVIASQLQPGRTDNDVKNYWNTKLKKKLRLLTAASRPVPTRIMMSPPPASRPALTRIPPPLPQCRPPAAVPAAPTTVKTEELACSSYMSTSTTAPKLIISSSGMTTVEELISTTTSSTSHDHDHHMSCFLSTELPPFPMQMMQQQQQQQSNFPQIPAATNHQLMTNVNNINGLLQLQLVHDHHVCPPEDASSYSSAASTMTSAHDINWSTTPNVGGRGGDLYEELGFVSYNELFLGWFGEVAPFYSTTTTSTKPQGRRLHPNTVTNYS